MKKLQYTQIKRLMPFSFLAVFLLIWEAAVRFWDIPVYRLPAPSYIIKTLFTCFPDMQVHALYTLSAAAIGFGIAIIVSMILAVIMDSSQFCRDGLYPLIVGSQTIPIIALAPLLLIWFGYGLLPKIIVVTLVCFFPIVVNLVEGMASAEEDLVNLLRVMGASSLQIFFKVKLPSSLPYFFSGLKIAATYSIMGAYIGEVVGSVKGLGIYMSRVTSSFATDKLFAAIIVISVLSIALFLIVELIARLVMPWKYLKKKTRW